MMGHSAILRTAAGALLGVLVLGRPGALLAEGIDVAVPGDSTAVHVTGERLRQLVVDGVPVLLLDGVRAEHGTTTLRGAVGRYDRLRERLRIEGDVEIRDRDTHITGDHATYDVASRLATIAGDVQIDRGQTTIRAPRASYQRDTRVARLAGGVEVLDRSNDRQVRADSLVYWADDDRARAFGRVRIDDREGEAVIRGEVADFDRSGDELHVSQEASMVLEESAQPVTVSADDLIFHSASNSIEAAGGVRVQQGLSESRSAAAVFDRDADRALLTGNPVALDPSGKVRGDTLVLAFRDGALNRLEAHGNARSVYRRVVAGDPQEREEMRLAGDLLTVRVRDSVAEEVELRGAATSVYVPAGERRAAGARLNRAEGEVIRVLFDHGEPLQAIVEGEARGLYVYAQEPGAVAGPDTLAAAVAPDTLAAAAPPDTLAADGDDLLGATVPVGPDSLLERIRYRAKRIVFLIEKSEIVLEKEAQIDYADTHLEADNVRFSADRRELVASGEPVLRDRSDEVKGDLMTYDLESREGSIVEGTTEFERGIYSGAVLRKACEGVFQVAGARYTTCDLARPHYHFTGRKMKIYVDDKVVSRPVGLYVGRVPILALPFYVFPIKKGRHSGLLLPRIEFGVSATRGRFVHGAGYYWVLNDYTDLELSADINEQSPFFIGNSRMRYAKRYALSGDLSTSTTFGEGQRRWDIRGQHRQILGEQLTLRANANFLSDRSFRQDAQGQFVEDRLETQLRSNLELNKSWSTQSLSLRAERIQNLQDTQGETAAGQGRVTGTFPAVTYSFNTRTIGRQPDAKGRGGRWPLLATTSYSFGLNYANSYDSNRKPSRTLQTAGGRGALTDRRSLGPFKVGPSFSVRSDYVERTEVTDADGNLVPDVGHVFTGSWRTSLDANADIYGLFMPTVGPFHGFRHTLTPRASLSYSDAFDSRQDNEGGPPASSLSLSLVNRVETRLSSGEDLRSLPDFLTFNASTTYDLSNRSSKRFSNIRFDARLRPGLGRGFEIRYEGNYDPYARRNVRYSASSRFSFERRVTRPRAPAGGGPAAGGDGEHGDGFLDPVGEGNDGRAPQAPVSEVERADLFPHAFRLRGTASFSGGGGSKKTLQTALGTGFNLTPKWRLDYEFRYDLDGYNVISQNYTISRDLHCWEAQFRRSFSAGRWEYYFRISIKDLPQLYYEKGSSSASRIPGLL